MEDILGRRLFISIWRVRQDLYTFHSAPCNSPLILIRYTFVEKYLKKKHDTLGMPRNIIENTINYNLSYSEIFLNREHKVIKIRTIKVEHLLVYRRF